MIAIAVIVAAAAAIVALPCFRPPFDAASETADPSAEEWTLKLDVARAAIKDLEFDHSMGRLSERDFLSLRSEFEARASVVLQELDNLHVTARMQGAKSRAGVGPPEGDGSLLEVAARVGQRDAGWMGEDCDRCGAPLREFDSLCRQCGAAARGAICAACGNRSAPKDKFCAQCGSPVNRTTAVAAQ